MSLQLARISELASQLQLPGIDNNVSELAQQAASQEWDYLTFLEKVLQCEEQARHQRKQSMFTRMAGFPVIKTLDGFDFTFASGGPRKQVNLSFG